MLALDPGGSTGGVLWNGSFMEAPFTLGPEPHHHELWLVLHGVEPDMIICESFDYRKSDESREKIEYISGEYIGIARLYARLHNFPFVTPSAALGKGFWTNEKLRAAGMVWSTKHEADAMRHMLRYITFDLRNGYWLQKLKASTNT